MNDEQKSDGRQKAVGEAEGIVDPNHNPHGHETADRTVGESAHGGRNTAHEGNEDDDEGAVEEVGHRIQVAQKGVEGLIAS